MRRSLCLMFTWPMAFFLGVWFSHGYAWLGRASEGALLTIFLAVFVAFGCVALFGDDS